MTPATIPDQAAGVLDFWFALSSDAHFAKDEELDRRIAARFAPLLDRLKAGGAAGWTDTPDTTLAAIIVLDQFARNIHRGSGEAFGGDTLAVALALGAIRRGFDRALAPERAMFLYMPLMHAEHAGLQHFAIECFEAAGLDDQVRFARAHAEVIDRFGRFPSRNAALGRESSAAELAYLARRDAGW
ncbi:DUF924 family protein [Sphingomonas sp. SFZ2018-12]|uniref:DUF924 family protein n=1 Tax=Sphingomonas sp. SFZ2018-12 TaxID=2683197 RepID=UPI001F0F6109|nr:DUF924 family protein [Sphingomonas sp. SFZ2018-12]MCH4892533.1 DUF924 family protein [Sphingomonas sp. SFZ2018-12]